MNLAFVCLSLQKIPAAQISFPCSDYWLSCSGADAYWEDEQGVMILYGYIHNIDFNQTPAHWLMLLRQAGAELALAMNMLDGAYNLVLLDKTSERCTLLTDRLGCQRLYYYQAGTALWLSPQLSVITDLLPERQFDMQGVMETVHFRWLSGQAFPLKGVQKMPHAAIIQLMPQQAPAILQRFGLLPARRTLAEKALNEHVAHVDQLLTANIIASVRPTDKVAVLLSGGVDSSILLGICCRLKLHVVAVTPFHEGHTNPELDTARAFAREMGVEHRVLAVRDVELRQLFCDTVQQLAAAPRSHSAVSLMFIMRQLSGEFDKVLYGEGADTLFGSRTIKHFANRYQKHLKLEKILKRLPGSKAMMQLLPPSSKVKALTNFNVPEAALSAVKLALLSDTEDALADELQLQPKVLLPQLNTDANAAESFNTAVRYLKQVVFSTDVVNHFYELDSLASGCQLQLVSPFVSWPVMSYAAQLPDPYYFGGQFVKPVLRKLGEQFYTPELMYLPKYGFPVPHKHWLDKPLQLLAGQAVEFFNVPATWAEDSEMIWTLTGLYLLAKQLHISPLCMTKDSSNSG